MTSSVDGLDDFVRARLEHEDVAWKKVASLLRDHVTIAVRRHAQWLPAEAFVRHALAHVTASTGNAEKLMARISTLHSADLYLALATAEGVRPAVVVFEKEHVERLRRSRSQASRLDDAVFAKLRERLPSYSGRSSLHDWARVTIARELRARESVISPSRRGLSSTRRVRARPARDAGSSSVR